MSTTTWTTPELAAEPVAWLGTSTPGGDTALVPTWFAWDGEAFLVASKPGARKVRNARANPRVMLGIARVGVEMEAQLVEGRAQVLSVPSAAAFRRVDFSKYDALLAADGLTRDAFFARYPTVLRIVPTRFLPWQGPALARAGGSLGVPVDPTGAGLRGAVRRWLATARSLVRRPSLALRPA